MKKLTLILVILLLLIGCSTNKEKLDSDSQVSFSESITATYTLPAEEDEEIEELTYRLPEISALNEEGEPTGNALQAYSLTPTSDFSEEDPIALASENFYAVNDVSDEQKDRLYWIAYYGYGYYELNESGLTKVANQESLTAEDYLIFHGDFSNTTDLAADINWLLAAQELIWESQLNEDGNPYGASFTTDLSSYKAEILQLVNATYQNVPNFGGSVITVQQSDIDSQSVYTLTEENGILHQFNINTTDDLELVSVEGNTIQVKLLNYVDDLAISFSRLERFDATDSLVYHDVDNQGYITFGNSRLKTLASKFHFEMNENLVGVSLSVTTIDQADSNNILYGGQYELADDVDFTINLIKSTLSEEGVNARFDNLTGKKFFMRQIVAPEGYALSEEIKEITVPANVSKLSITFVNEVEIIDPDETNE